MRSKEFYIVLLLLLGAGLLGALAALGQESRAPWPPPPVVPPEDKDPPAIIPTRNQVRKPVEPAPATPEMPKSQTGQTDPPPVEGSMVVIPKESPEPIPLPPRPQPQAPDSPPLPGPVNVDNDARSKETEPPILPPPAAPVGAGDQAAPKERAAPIIPPPPTTDGQEKNAAPPPLPPPILGEGKTAAPSAANPGNTVTVPDRPPREIVKPAPPPIPEVQAQLPSAVPTPRDIAPPRPPALQRISPSKRAAPPTVTGPELGSANGNSAKSTLRESSGPVLGQPAPALAVEKRGPSYLRLGQIARYEIVVRNVGSVTAQRVRIEDELPGGARFIHGEPPPAVEGERIIWNLDALTGGSERKLTLEMQPTVAGEIATSPTVTLSVASRVRTVVAPARLAVQLTGPDHAAVGQAAEFDVQVINTAAQTRSGLLVRVRLPQGLTTSWGNHIEAPIGELKPGDSKKFKVPANAVQPGRHVVEVTILGPEGEEAATQASIQVVGGGLTLRHTGATHLLVDRPGELRVEVSNGETRPAHNVQVTETLPDGLEFISASDRGIYRGESRTIHWLADYLAAGESKAFTVKVQSSRTGLQTHQALARADGGSAVQSEATVVIEGAASLTLQVTDRDDPLELGKETIYEIRVQNQGTSADGNVNVQVSFPEGLVPREAWGPALARIQGRSVTFAPLARLNANAEVIYRVKAQAVSPGDQRVRVQLTSAQVRQAVFREERTRVYRD